MNKSIAVVALALAAAGTAHADDPTLDTYGTFASMKTRAEVKAERVQVKRDVWSNSYNPLTMTRPAKTRNRVLDELEDAQENGQLRAFSGEDSGSAYLAARAPRRVVNATHMLAGTPRAAQ